jgi:hypothetical protein
MSDPTATTAPGSAVDPAAPTPSGGSHLVRNLLVALSVIVLTVAITAVVARLVRGGGSPFPAGWFTTEWTMSPSPTAAQADDAGQMVLAELAHLGDPSARYVVDGDKLRVGTPTAHDTALNSLYALALRPEAALRGLVRSGPTSQDPINATLGDGEPCNDHSRKDIACSADRTVIGQFGQEWLDGADIADATASQAGGEWSVTVRFTPAGAGEFANAVKIESGRELVFLITVVSTETWALTPMLGGHGMRAGAAGQGVVTGLTQDEARRVAATLRLCRKPIELKPS